MSRESVDCVHLALTPSSFHRILHVPFVGMFRVETEQDGRHHIIVCVCVCVCVCVYTEMELTAAALRLLMRVSLIA